MKLRVITCLASLLLVGCESSRVEDAVRRQMRDPDATQFREVSRCPADNSVWRGEYNAKNGFGAYNGFQSFYYADGYVITAGQGDILAALHRCFGRFAEDSPKEASEGASRSAGQKYPYTAPDGVDIRNESDEVNWKRYGTTDPHGGD